VTEDARPSIGAVVIDWSDFFPGICIRRCLKELPDGDLETHLVSDGHSSVDEAVRWIEERLPVGQPYFVHVSLLKGDSPWPME
jgi:hypothetical protein